jgi:hypothetical protein
LQKPDLNTDIEEYLNTFFSKELEISNIIKQEN